jgi:histidine decarboxylase
VVFPIPPQTILDTWPVAVDHDHGVAHLICMPGVTTAQIDAFVTALAETTSAPALRLPGPRPSPQPRPAPAGEPQ